MSTSSLPRRRLGAVAALAALVMLVVAGCSGSTSSPTPPTTPPATASGVPKPYIVGLMDRKGPPTTDLLTHDGKPLVSAFVIQVNWNDVQPNGPDDFDTSKIDEQIAFAQQHDLPVRLRVFAGYHSPQWALQQAGSVQWQGSRGKNGPSSYTVPVFWGAEFQKIYQQFDAKLAAKYDPVPQVREFDAGMCVTNFPEPFIRQFNDKANVTAAAAKGYTDAASDACLRRTIDMVKADWPTTNMVMAFNPYQSITNTGDNDRSLAVANTSVAVPKEIATYCIEQLGPRCVPGNDSMQGGSRGPAYDALYAMMKGLKAPLYIQTATDAKINNWQQALTSAVQLGALTVELPVGYKKWDLGTLETYNAQLQANRDKLVQ